MGSLHNLIWDDYSKDIESGLCEIFRTGILHDVTLTAEGQKITAHKLVLALSSPHFKQLFSDNSTSNQQAIIFVSEISFRALKVLVEFMYTGEVSVPEDLKAEVLRGAKIFHIGALMQKPYIQENEGLDIPSPQVSNNSRRMKRVSRIPYRYQYDETIKKKKTNNSESKSDLYMELNGVSDINNDTQSNTSYFDNDPICLPEESDLLDLQLAEDVPKFDDAESTDVDVLGPPKEVEEEEVDDKTNIVLLGGGIMPASLKYIRNKNGNLCLVLNDHVYLKQTICKNKIFWRCQMHSKGCRSRCVTQGNIIVKKVAVHSHAPQTDKVIQCEIDGEIVYM